MTIPFREFLEGKAKRTCQHCGALTTQHRCDGCGAVAISTESQTVDSWNAPKSDKLLFGLFAGLLVAAFGGFVVGMVQESTQHSGVVVSRDFHKSIHYGKFFRRERWCLLVKGDDGEVRHTPVSREEYESVKDGELWNPK